MTKNKGPIRHGCSRALPRHLSTRLPEQISRGGADDLSRASGPATVTITPNYTSWNQGIFPAHQSGNTGQFVGDALFGGMHFVTVGITAATIVVDRLHSGKADGGLGQSLTPGAAEAVGDDHW